MTGPLCLMNDTIMTFVAAIVTLKGGGGLDVHDGCGHSRGGVGKVMTSNIIC